MLSIRCILHPTDFSQQSADASDWAISLARDYHARLILLHVMEPDVVYGEFTEIIARPTNYRDILLDALRRMGPQDPGIEVDYFLEDGDPATSIVRVAEEQRCDLIVMSTHGRSGVMRLLMGSVAEKVLRNAPCPVLNVKTPPPGQQKTS